MSFSHDIDQICRAFADTALAGSASAETAILHVADLPASRVAQVRFSRPTGDLSVFIKQLHSRSPEEHAKHRALIRKEADLLEEIFGRFGRAGPISVIEPLACFPEMLALVTRAEDGIVPLDAFIKARAYASLRDGERSAHLERLASDLGHWLRAVGLMAKPLDVGDFLERRRRHMIDGLERLTSEGVIAPHTREALRDSIHRTIPQVLDAGVVSSPFHGDFLPGNVFVRPGGTGAVLLDFADGGVGTVYTDLASMVEWLEFLRYKLAFARTRIARVRDAFLHGFADGHELQTSLFGFLRLEVLIDGLQGHTTIMRATGRAALLHRSLNQLKYRYLLRRLDALARPSAS